MKSSISTATTNDPHTQTLRSMNQRIDAYTNKLQSVFLSGGAPDDSSIIAKSTRSISSRYSKPSPAARRTGLDTHVEAGRNKYSLCEEVMIEDGKRRARLLCDSRLQSVQKKIDEVQTANLSHTSRHQSPSLASVRNRMEIPTPDRQLEKLRQYGAASERGTQGYKPPTSSCRERIVRDERSRSRPHVSHHPEYRPREAARACAGNDEYMMHMSKPQPGSTPREAASVREAFHKRQSSHHRDTPSYPDPDTRSYQDRVSLRGAHLPQDYQSDRPNLSSRRELPVSHCTIL